MQKQCAEALAPITAVVADAQVFTEPTRTRGGAAGRTAAAAAYLHARLLAAYLAFPNAAAYSAQHETIAKLFLKTLRTGAFFPQRSEDASRLAATCRHVYLFHVSADTGTWGTAQQAWLEAFTG